MPSLLLCRLMKINATSKIAMQVSLIYWEKYRIQDLPLINFYRDCARNGIVSKSQNLQDIATLYFFQHLTKGFFVEVGAAFAEKDSNTYLLQHKFGWGGVLVEPNPTRHPDLASRVTNEVELCSAALSNRTFKANLVDDGGLSRVSDLTYISLPKLFKFRKRDNFIIETLPVNKFVELYNIKRIDYLSIDTEGMDFEILKAFFDEEIYPDFITVEHNYDFDTITQISDLSHSLGYEVVFPSWSTQDIWLKKATHNQT
jgi:FkbM family methyltransferase